MPKPKENEIPDNEKWTFIQRSPDFEAELKPLAKNLVKFNGQNYEPLKANILSFLGGTPQDRIGKWSDFWLSIIQTLGLAYETSFDNLLHTTSLSKYLSETNDSQAAFFNYWALKFQFPWARNKHKLWKDTGKVVQPVVFMMRHLITIFEQSLAQGNNSFEETYLTFEEIILVLMKSGNYDIYTIRENVNLILARRQNSFDYERLKVTGYETVENQFANRTRKFFERVSFIKFNDANNRVELDSWQQLLKILTFLSYAKKPISVINEETRVNLFEQAFNILELTPTHLNMVINKANESSEIDPTNFNLPKIVNANLSAKGFTYNLDFIEAFLLSLKTKPFLILTGISGTGKTALPKMIMSLIGNEDCKPIAVAPDWTDNTDMLGYFNIENEFIIGEFTTLVQKASKNKETPFFVILDEMNLARVEYYFAQVLSVIESRKFDSAIDDVIYDDFLFNQAMRERLKAQDKEEIKEIADLRIPSNLYIIGTVNVDETTHPFSKKVLDRANVLETNNVDLMQGLIDDPIIENNDITKIPALNYFFKGNITNLNELKKHWETNYSINLDMMQTLTLWIEKLTDFNELLKTNRTNFGFRVRDEVCIYLYHSANLTEQPFSTNWWHKFFDQQLVQKILTRFAGEQGQIENHITELFNLCLDNGTYTRDQIQTLEITEDDNIIFPKAANKLQLMLKEVTTEDKPSTSFWTV
jgi:tRNA uridine 5-carbamoylmethylation protein Kti12